MYWRIISFLIVVIFAFGCGKKKLGIVDYQNYINNGENGLRIETIKNNIKSEFSLEPMEWQAFKASYSDKKVDPEKFKNYKKENRGLLQFSFKVFLPEKADLYNYFSGKYENPQEAMLYAEYDMKDDFVLSMAQDSLHAFATHHQPSFGLKPYEEFLVLFKTDDENIEDKPIRILYRDHLFELDTLSYLFEKETMQNIPILNIK